MTTNADVSVRIHKNIVCKKDYVWNPRACVCKINIYLKSNAGNLVITCNEIINVLDTVSINLNDKKAACKVNSY